jgi:hypothetical protein
LSPEQAPTENLGSDHRLLMLHQAGGLRRVQIIQTCMQRTDLGLVWRLRIAGHIDSYLCDNDSVALVDLISKQVHCMKWGLTVHPDTFACF